MPHRDVGRVEEALRTRGSRRALVVTDAVFSVDGDAAPLDDLIRVAEQHGGVARRRRGARARRSRRRRARSGGLAGLPCVRRTSSSRRRCRRRSGRRAAWCSATREVTAHLIDAARPFIFDTALAPAAVGGALAALRILQDEPELATRARDHAQHLRAIADGLGLTGPEPAAAVTSVLIGAPADAVAAADACAARGVRVGCFRPPSVPDGISRLRLTARANLTAADLDLAAQSLTAVASLAKGRMSLRLSE